MHHSLLSPSAKSTPSIMCIATFQLLSPDGLDNNCDSGERSWNYHFLSSQLPCPPPTNPSMPATASALWQVHIRLVISELHQSLPLLTKLLSFLISSISDSFDYFFLLLNSIPHPDPFLFTSPIRSASKSRLPLPPPVLLPLPHSNFIFISLLKFSVDFSSSRISIHFHAVIHRFDSDSYVQPGLVDLYPNVGLGTAWMLFDRMLEKDIVAWNAMKKEYKLGPESSHVCTVDMFGRDGLLKKA